MTLAKRSDRPGGEDTNPALETDGGTGGKTDEAFRTYTDDEYGYTLAYPADWSVEPDPDGGVTFEAPESTVGVTVFVERGARLTPEASAEAFLAELRTDEHVRALELAAPRSVRSKTDQTAALIECSYSDESCERWWLEYLFVRHENVSYTLGIDWSDTVSFGTTADAIVASFTLDATGSRDEARRRFDIMQPTDSESTRPTDSE